MTPTNQPQPAMPQQQMPQQQNPMLLAALAQLAQQQQQQQSSPGMLPGMQQLAQNTPPQNPWSNGQGVGAQGPQGNASTGQPGWLQGLMSGIMQHMGLGGNTPPPAAPASVAPPVVDSGQDALRKAAAEYANKELDRQKNIQKSISAATQPIAILGAPAKSKGKK